MIIGIYEDRGGEKAVRETETDRQTEKEEIEREGGGNNKSSRTCSNGRELQSTLVDTYRY